MRKFLLVVVAGLATLVVAAVPASASLFESGSFAGGGPGPGGNGSADGQLLNPGAAAMRTSTGKLYVADTGNNRVQVFTTSGSTGAYDSQVAITAPTGVAIDQDTGDVYVSNPSGVLKFDENLDPITAGWTAPTETGPIEVDPVDHQLVVANQSANSMSRYGSDGTLERTFPVNRPLDFAIDSTGDIIAITSTGDIMACNATSAVEHLTREGTLLTTIGSLDAPGAVTVDPDDDSITVAAQVNQWLCNTGKNPTLSMFDPDGTPGPTTTLAGDALFATVPGLVAAGGGSNKTYAVTKSPMGDTFGATAIHVLSLVPATLTDPVVTNIGGTQADVSATVNPNGGPTPWAIEYSDDGGSTWQLGDQGDAGNGTDPVTVSAALTGLNAKTAYVVRVRAETTPSGQTSFTTGAAPPRVVTQPAVDVTTSGARLQGAVDPQASPATYWFEYGTTTQYGSRIPLSQDADAGTGNRYVPASQTLTDLPRDTTYHYRLVARNAEGTVMGDDATLTTTVAKPSDPCANAAIRAQQHAQRLPDCRAYEMTSPVQKNNGGVAIGNRASDDGDAVGFVMNAATGPQDGAFGATPWIAHRTADGWKPLSAAPPIRSEVRGSAGVNSPPVDFSNDFSQVFLRTNDPMDPADLEPFTTGNLNFGYDLYAYDPINRAARWVSKPDAGTAAAYGAGGSMTYGGRSADGHHVLFTTNRILVTGAPFVSNGALYESVDGAVRPVSVLPNGTLNPTNSALARTPTSMAPVAGNPAISRDGSRIFWWTASTSAATGAIYLREDGVRTVAVTASHRTTNNGTSFPGTFLGASADGSRVFFHSTTQLLDVQSGTRGVYMWERDTTDPLGGRLTFLASTLTISADSWPVTSQDGKRFYFKSSTILAPGAVTGQANLYLWDDGTLKFVAATGTAAPNVDPRVRISADGRYAVFTTERSLDPRQSAGVNGVYLYDADSGDIACASCRPDGVPGTHDALLRSTSSIYSAILAPNLTEPRNVLADGKVFFQTAEPLQPQDTNAAQDVYEFDHGQVKLLTSGSGANSELIDTSADGKSVFFITPNSLVGKDIDGGYPDVYVARVDGGFPEPPPAAAGCSGDDCQGAPAPAVSWAPAGTVLFSGGGNLPSVEPAPAPARGKATVSKLKTIKGSTASLKVKVPGAGRLSAAGSGLVATKRSVTKAGTVTVKVALSKRARATLAKRHVVKVKVRVVFAPRGGKASTVTVPLTFKPSSTKKGR